MFHPKKGNKGKMVTQPVTVIVQSQDQQEVTRFSARPGSNLWFLLRKHGIAIGSACSGVGVCASCDLDIEYFDDKQPEICPVNPEESFEQSSKARNGIAESRRLACLVRVWGNIIVRSAGF